MRLKTALPAVLIIAAISVGAALNRPSEKMDLRAFPLFGPSQPSPVDQALMRVTNRLESPTDRIHYSAHINVHQISDAAANRIVRELEDYLRLGMLQPNEKKLSVMVIGHCARLPYARALLRRISADTRYEPELRRHAVRYFMPNDLAPLPDSAYLESLGVLRKYLRSPEPEDRQVALWAVGNATMRPLEQELLAMFGREKELSVKTELLRKYGWCSVTRAFDLVERESHSANELIKAAAVNALSLYGAAPQTLPVSAQRRLRRRLEALRGDPDFSQDADFGLSHMGSAGLTEPGAAPRTSGAPASAL
ncbi:MAG: hypothetical protein ACO1SX_06045 [Actinomycetota bacterium]